MEKKIAERTNVLTETENTSFIHAVINAVTKGYSDHTVLEDIIDLVRRKEVSKGVIQTASDALREYGESLHNSLKFLADKIDELEIIDEPTVKQRQPNNDQNVVEEEMQQVEQQQQQQQQEKKSSNEKISSLKITEDWEKFCQKDDSISGILKFSFNHDLSQYTKNNKVVLNEKDIDIVLSKVYSYFKSEFKNLKVSSLTRNIFKSSIRFTSLEKGEAEAEYEIKGAF